MPHPAANPPPLGDQSRRPAAMLFALSLLIVGLIIGLVGGSVGCSPPSTPTPPPSPAPVTPRPVVLPGTCDHNGYCGAFQVGGQLHAATWLDADRMYLADAAGNIRLLNVTTGAVATVLTGDGYYKGITLLDGRLYLSDSGPLRTALLAAGESGRDANLKIALTARPVPDLLEFARQFGGQVVSYQTGPDGSLSDRQVVIDHIAAFDLYHGANGLTNDGEYVYLSIGHPAYNIPVDGPVVRALIALNSGDLRTDWWGTIVRFRPPNNSVAIHAAGLRNTYGLSIAPDGVIYGADNDETPYPLAGAAPPVRTHLEELNALVPGGFYGYPFYGTRTSPPPDTTVTEPAAVIPGFSSTATHANPDGVYLAYIAPGAGFVLDRFAYGTFTPSRIYRSDGLITAILERQGRLYLTTLSGQVLVLDPAIKTQDNARQLAALQQRLADNPGQLAAPAAYDLYFDPAAKTLNYIKKPCAPADAEPRFFLHLIPSDPAALSAARRPHGFANLDFALHWHGGWLDGQCIASVPLPDYPLDRIRTGQFVAGQSQLWQVEFPLEK